MRSLWFALLGVSLSLSAGAESVKAADGNPRVRFLGINGFEFKWQGETLLIDPYVSRAH